MTEACPYCLKPITWMRNIEFELIMVEREVTEVITESGRKIKGQKPHICQKEGE